MLENWLQFKKTARIWVDRISKDNKFRLIFVVFEGYKIEVSSSFFWRICFDIYEGYFQKDCHPNSNIVRV